MSGRSRDGCVVAYSRANRSISFAGRPTVAASSPERIAARIHERLVPDCVLRNVLVVHQTVADDDVHHRERQRRVAGRLDRQVPVGRFRGPGPDRIHDDDLRAPTLRLAHERPKNGGS